MGFENTQYNGHVKNKEVGTIFGVTLHEDKDTILYAIRTLDDNREALIGEKGLIKVEDAPKMYSEEEVKSFLNSIISEIGIRKENIEKNQDKMPIHLLEGGLIAFESSIDVIKESFEQFKKK
jgi:hypothetical protein